MEKAIYFKCSCFTCMHAQSCLPLCDPLDCSMPDSPVHGIFKARILEWVAISSSTGSFWPRDWTRVFCIICIGKQILYQCTTWEAPQTLKIVSSSSLGSSLYILCLSSLKSQLFWNWKIFFPASFMLWRKVDKIIMYNMIMFFFFCFMNDILYWSFSTSFVIPYYAFETSPVMIPSF